MKTEFLEFATNLFGNVDENIKGRVLIYLDEPTTENWDDIYCIIINKKHFETIWQAVIKVDSNFPLIGRKEDSNGNIIEDWRKIPSPETLIKAIQNSVYDYSIN